MQRHAISTAGLRSQSWDEFENYDADAIITLCDQAAAETCPVWFGDAPTVHWGLSDPSKSDDDAEFDKTIDILIRRIQALKMEIETLTSDAQIKVLLEGIAARIV